MKYIKKIDQIKYLHELVQKKGTGTPIELANRMGISRSSLYNLIEELKLYNAPIAYCRTQKTFYYTKQFELKLQYIISVIEEETELKEINGGFYFCPSFLDGDFVNL